MVTETIQTPVGLLPNPSNWLSIINDNGEVHSHNTEDTPVMFLEKATDGRSTISDIKFALDEYKRLYKAGIASPAEILTLSRAYPENDLYTKALKKMDISDDDSLVVGGPASIELVDREGHLITTKALGKAFKKYMANFRTRNAMVLHSDVQVGWALPAYISKGGQTFKSGVDDKGLFFITELRNDTKIAKKVMEQIHAGKLKSYSIAGSAIKTQNIQKGLQEIMQVDELELAEVTVCEKGVNQGAAFDILKAAGAATSSCIDGSCLITKEESCNCGCDESLGVELMYKSDGDIDFTKSFLKLMGTEDVPIKKIIQEEGKVYGESFPTLLNIQGRQEEHHRLLDAYGFPSELEAEYARYTPVIEEDPSILAHTLPPWIVNEAGQNLGERHYEDALTTPQLSSTIKRGVVEGGNSTETPVSQLNATNTLNNILAKEEEELQKFGPLAALAAIPAAAIGAAGSVVSSLLSSDKESSRKLKDRKISKSQQFFSWVAKSDPMVRVPHLLKDGCSCENCFQKNAQYKGTIEKEANSNSFAIATAQAKKEGYEDFSEDGDGTSRRDEIAEAIKT